MAYGRLGVLVPTVATLSVVCTISSNCAYCEDLSISVTNPNAAIATISIAISTTTTPNANEYIVTNYPLEALNGYLSVTKQLLSPNEKVVVISDKADTVFRVSGKEIII